MARTKKSEKEKIIKAYIKCLKGRCSKAEKSLLKKSRKKIKVGLTGGVFDLIHLGHVRAFKEAKSKVDVLIVVIAREESIIKKGRIPIHTLKERVELVNSIKYVDLAIPGQKDKKKTLEKVKPDVVFYGYDQREIPDVEGVRIAKLKPYRQDKLKTSIIERHY